VPEIDELRTKTGFTDEGTKWVPSCKFASRISSLCMCCSNMQLRNSCTQHRAAIVGRVKVCHTTHSSFHMHQQSTVTRILSVRSFCLVTAITFAWSFFFTIRPSLTHETHAHTRSITGVNTCMCVCVCAHACCVCVSVCA